MHACSNQYHKPVPPLIPLPTSYSGMRRGLQLEHSSYEPRALLQRTMEVFNGAVLRNHSEIAEEDKFVSRFKSWQDQTEEDELQELMRSLDKFFFSGILTRGQRPMIKLEFRDDIFDQVDELGKNDREILGKTTEVDEGDSTALRMNIEVDATHPHRRKGRIVKRDLMDVLETLVHEMAHAYFMLFACQCKSCEMQTGATGHGPVWQELKEVMYMTIRQWDPSLRNFYADDWDRLD